MNSPSSRSLSVLTRDLLAIRRSAGVKVAFRYMSAVLGALAEVRRTGNLVAADRQMSGAVYTFSVIDDARPVLVDTRPRLGVENVFGAAREMYCRRVYFPDGRFTIHAGDTVVDLGANIGLFSTLAAIAGATVYAVEAQSGFIPFIRENLSLNGLEHAVDVELAFVEGGSGVLGEATRVASHWYEDSPSLTMSELVSRKSLSCIDFLKVDIEGSEFAMFSHDLGWLPLVKRVAMEVHRDYGDPRTIVQTLEQVGFAVWLTDNRFHRVARLDSATGFIYALRGGARLPSGGVSDSAG